jgi:hypothetical protein
MNAQNLIWTFAEFLANDEAMFREIIGKKDEQHNLRN